MTLDANYLWHAAHVRWHRQAVWGGVMPIFIGIVGYEVEQHERVSALITAVGGPVKAAALIKKTRQTIDNMRRPGARLSIDDLLPLCIEAGVSLDWVATGHQVRPDLSVDDSVAGLPLRPLRGRQNLSVPAEWLQGIAPEHARWASVDDDGMAPVLPKDAKVIIDTRPAPLKGGLYLIDLDGELVARRLNRLPGNEVELAAAGEATWRFRFDQANPPSLLHRIVWHGQAAA